MLFDVRAGENRQGFLFDLWARTVTLVDPQAADSMMMRIVIPAAVFRQALLERMFGHAAISKRLRWQATKADMGRLDLFSGLLSWHESEVIPLRRLLSRRCITSYAARWRELLLYARLGLGKLQGRDLRGQEERLLARHGSANLERLSSARWPDGVSS